MSLSLFLMASPTWAYPEFVGYGYKSCLTCHYNGHGSGPINDYGRSVWASEIASRSLYSNSLSLEQISERSGFLGKAELPYWIRPHVKYRSIQVMSNIKGTNQRWDYYPMQLDVGAALFLDSDNKYGLVYTLGHIPTAETSEAKTMNHLVTKDLYLRFQLADPLWLYVGKMDKVFGIRNIDHTSFQRQPQGLGQNSQSLGATIHWVQETYELTAQYFSGNPQSNNTSREQKGTSLMTEFDVGKSARAGLSALNSVSDLKEKVAIYSTHWRQGLVHGSSIEFEVGQLQTKSGTTTYNGSYSFAQSLILLRKGVHLLTNLERFNRDVAATSSEQWRLGLGLLWFPINRTEVRLGTFHQRSVSSQLTAEDSWVIHAQLHLSL